MSKQVLDVGNCGFDHAAIRRMVEVHFDASVVRADGAEDACRLLRQGGIDLVLVNRVFDRDGGDGLALIREIKAEGSWAGVPVMLLSNYPHFQESAESLGAEPGFGKADIGSDGARQLLGRYLPDRVS